MKKLFLIIPFLLISINLYSQNDGLLSWTQDLTGAGAIWQGCIVINPANEQIMYCASNTAGVWKSTNNGVNWAPAINGLTVLSVQALAISLSTPTTLYAGTGTGGMFKTTDAGGNWTQINSGITQSPQAIQSIAIKPNDPNTVVICVWDGVATLDASIGVFKTTNGGTLWAGSNAGFGPNKNALSLCINPLNANTLYTGTSFYNPGGTATGPCYVYKSYDFGSTWINSSTGFGTAAVDQDPVRSLSLSSDTTTILAGRFWNTSNGGPWLSTNAGASWTQKNGGIIPIAFPGSLIRSCLFRPGSNTEMYFGGDPVNQQPGGVWKTTNAGTTWTDFNSGVLLNTYTVRALAWRNDGQTLFAGVAGTLGIGVYDYGYIPVGISDPNTGTPKEFALKQNYPNPFNPNTIIDYALPKSSFVTVKVYNAMGQEIKTLVNEQKQAGNFSVNFNASNLPSGVYFCKLIAGDFVSTKKMMLVK